MADVSLAEDTVLDRLVALKRLRSVGDHGAVARLRREALVGASLSHPNLVSVYDVWEEEDGDLVIVMEYVEGSNLRDLVRTHGALPTSRALRILAGVAAALDAVHEQGIVHRDVKPANILVGGDGRVKLADLGIAAVEDNTRITTSGEVVGTFRYMAPEQLEGRDSAPAMDIYALAAVAFEALSGRKARAEPNPLALAHAIATQPPPDLRKHLPGVSPMAATVLQRGMAADPTQRPRSASELVGRLRAALDPDTTEADAVAEIAAAAALHTQPPIVTSPTTERGRRRPGALVWALIAMLVLAAGVIAAIVVTANPHSGRGRPTAPHTRSAAHASSTAHAPSTGRTSSTPTGQTSSTPTGQTSSAPTGQTSSTPPASSTAPPSSTPVARAGATPASAVETFYELSARHDFASAWALADANMRAQLGGYASFHGQMSRVQSITFHSARTVSTTGTSPATVALSTTSVLDSGTQKCSGTARTVQGGEAGTWVLDGISITCRPA